MFISSFADGRGFLIMSLSQCESGPMYYYPALHHHEQHYVCSEKTLCVQNVSRAATCAVIILHICVLTVYSNCDKWNFVMAIG